MATDSLQSSVIFPCECEHKNHTEEPRPGHRYLAPFKYSALTAVCTPYGTFVVCKDCAGDCYKDFPAAIHGPGE